MQISQLWRVTLLEVRLGERKEVRAGAAVKISRAWRVTLYGVMTCEECGGELPEPYSALGRPRLFCSDACRQRAYRGRGGVASGTTGAERRRREQERRRASGRGTLRLAVVAAAADRLQDVMQVTGQRVGGGDDMRSGLDLVGAVAAGCGDEPAD